MPRSQTRVSLFTPATTPQPVGHPYGFRTSPTSSTLWTPCCLRTSVGLPSAEGAGGTVPGADQHVEPWSDRAEVQRRTIVDRMGDPTAIAAKGNSLPREGSRRTDFDLMVAAGDSEPRAPRVHGSPTPFQSDRQGRAVISSSFAWSTGSGGRPGTSGSSGGGGGSAGVGSLGGGTVMGRRYPPAGGRNRLTAIAGFWQWGRASAAPRPPFRRWVSRLPLPSPRNKWQLEPLAASCQENA